MLEFGLAAMLELRLFTRFTALCLLELPLLLSCPPITLREPVEVRCDIESSAARDE